MNTGDTVAMTDECSLSEFGKSFDAFTKMAFRFESLPQYKVDTETESFALFLRGQQLPSTDFNDDWRQVLYDARQRGAAVCRVRLLPVAPNDYIRFEYHWGYRPNAQRGEIIRLITEKEFAPLDFGGTVVRTDYWLFDDLTAYLMLYSSDGVFTQPRKANSTLLKKLVDNAKILFAAAHDLPYFHTYLEATG
jgi:hypothetical protein